MNDYIYLDNTPTERQTAARLLNFGYFIAYKDRKEILLKKRK